MGFVLFWNKALRKISYQECPAKIKSHFNAENKNGF